MSKTRSGSKVPLAELTEAQGAELDRVERQAILEFEGPIDDLEKALGLLRLGYHLGWRPLVLVHSKPTIAKLERILNIRLREMFPEEGPSCMRSQGYKLARKLSNFWKAVSGETPVPDRQLLQK